MEAPSQAQNTAGKRILKGTNFAVYTAVAVAIIVNPNNPQADQQLQELQAAARTLGVQVEAFKAGTPNEIDTAFANVVQRRAGALHMAGDAFFNTRKEQFIVLLYGNSLPPVV